MPNPTPDVDDEMQTVFLTAKSNAEMVGHGGVAYCWGLQAVVELIDEREGPTALLRDLRAMFMREQPQGLGSPELIDQFARERGISL